MQMLIHCPGCARPLHLPQGASGHQARCPACHAVFVVPDPKALEEETFSAWIEQEVAQARQERDEELPPKTEEAKPLVAPNAPAAPIAVAAPVPAAPVAAAVTPAALPKPAPPPKPATPAPTPPLAASQTLPPTPPPPAPEPSRTIPALSATTSPKPDPGPGTARLADAATIPTDSTRPHLTILECTSKGVRFAFDAAYLTARGFRASMPVRCVACGNDQRTALLVRPVTFPDQVRANIGTGKYVEAHHQHHLQANQSPRDLLAIMGELEEMEKPFNLPMPYYICQTCAAGSLHGATTKRPEGGFTCELHVHCGQVALDWLGRVNGVCGEAYLQLEDEVAVMNSDAWRSLSEAVRKRLEVWCDFQPGERFTAYFSDADFGARDAGLAGIAITTHRLLFSKYHHHVRISLQDPATLQIKPETNTITSLTLQTANHHRTRLGKYRRADIEQLSRLLQETSRFTIEETGQPGEAEAVTVNK